MTTPTTGKQGFHIRDLNRTEVAEISGGSGSIQFQIGRSNGTHVRGNSEKIGENRRNGVPLWPNRTIQWNRRCRDDLEAHHDEVMQ